MKISNIELNTNTIKIIIIIILIINPVFSQTWDVDSDEPPESNSKPLPRPTKIQPFYLLAYNHCITGEPVFDIKSVYGSIGFVSSIAGDTAVVDLKIKERRDRNSKIYFPEKVFYLKVIMGRYGTALFKIDITGNPIVIDYTERLDLLQIMEIRELPENSIYIQFMTKNSSADALKFIEDFKKECGESARIITLDNGFYRCVPTNEVTRTRIGSKRNRTIVNSTTTGYLVCVQVLDEEAYRRIESWVFERQKEQWRKAGLPGEVKPTALKGP